MASLVTEFQDIAKQLGASLSISEDKVDIGGGARSPVCVFLLDLNYKGRTINIKNSTGTHFYGYVHSTILDRQSSNEFELTTQSHFSNLFSSIFSKNKDRFKIKTSSNAIKAFIRTSESVLGLRVVAQKDVFEPTIIGINTDGKYDLIIEYSLQFNDWPEAIIPIANFYKAFIDTFSD